MNSTLHLISHRLDEATLGSLWRSRSPDDTLLLSGDAVYLALRPEFLALAGSCAALACDVEARGLSSLWPACVALTDHAGMVDRCVRHRRTLSWA